MLRSPSSPHLLLAALLAAGLVAQEPPPTTAATTPTAAPLPMRVPVFVVRYFPVAGERIDRSVTGDWGETLAATQAKCDRLTKELADALAEGSRYHGYKDPASQPNLRYEVLETVTFLQPLPTRPKRRGEQVPLPDYRAILRAIDIERQVARGCKQVWIWAYHGGVVGLWESNMASPTGDVSNSNRDPDDLPVLASTYTVYHFNYQRDLGEALENHMHQLEALLNHVDGRDRTPPDRWSELLFWGRFVGSDASHKIVTKPARCGWTHYAPNSEHDYDWQNERYVETDIEDWHPDHPGKVQRINCERWGRDPVRWRIYWLQAIPGAGSGLTCRGKPLTNWWSFVADWDLARREGRTLVAK
ncbi:MAG: hypothetical protein FJ265_02440 [Planctomycetes bacterium]|nr:hypothetical protein [Planctomycetota bacterium]